MFIRRDLTYIHHPVSPHDDNQYISITVKRRLTITVVGAYLSPSSRFDHTRLQGILSATSHPCIIIGDFNAHHTIWGSSKTNVKGRKLVSFASDNQLFLLNDGSPTFLRGSRYSSCLDLAFVSRGLVRHAEWFPDMKTHGSDHTQTYVKIEGFFHNKIRNSAQRVDWLKFESRMGEQLQAIRSLDIEEIIKSTIHDTTRTLTCSPKVTEFYIKLERLRVV